MASPMFQTDPMAHFAHLPQGVAMTQEHFRMLVNNLEILFWKVQHKPSHIKDLATHAVNQMTHETKVRIVTFNFDLTNA